jgi:hypothetical protein
VIRTEGTEAVVALEDAEPDVLFEHIPGTGIPLWPLLRWPLARSTQEIELNTVAVTRTITRTQYYRRLATRVLPNRHAGSRTRLAADVMFWVDGGTFSQTPQGRRNWLVDDLAEAVDDRALVLQDLPLDSSTPRSERPQFGRATTFAGALTRVDIAAWAHRSDHRNDHRIREIIRETFAALPFAVDETRIADIERRVLYRVRRVAQAQREFERVLDRVRPRLVVMQLASYGDRAPMISAMHDRGILVAEPQHGWIGPYHVSYNFGSAMWRPELKTTLPDVLLTFGEFWSSIVRTPSELVAIGKPHLEQQAAAGLVPGAKKREVLVISSVFQREELTRFTLQLRDALPPAWTVRFRPHPSERTTVDALYAGLVDQSRIEFDRTPDVAEPLVSASAVFGLASTVLYEALAFGCDVFVIDSPLANLSSDVSTFGERISDAASLGRAVEELTRANGVAPIDRDLLESIWAPHAVENFRRFVDERVPVSPAI